MMLFARQFFGGGSATDWSVDERAAIRAILGIPSSGSTPETPTTGVLANIEDELAAIKAKTNLIGTGAAGTGGAPVADDGNLKELIIGDDYSVDNGQELQWTVNLPDNTTIAGAKCYFGGYHSDPSLADDNNWLVEGTVLEGPTASQAIIRFNFLRAINSTLAEGDYNWHAEIWNDAGLQSTRVRSKKTRRVTLVKKQIS